MLEISLYTPASAQGSSALWEWPRVQPHPVPGGPWPERPGHCSRALCPHTPLMVGPQGAAHVLLFSVGSGKGATSALWLQTPPEERQGLRHLLQGDTANT